MVKLSERHEAEMRLFGEEPHDAGVLMIDYVAAELVCLGLIEAKPFYLKRTSVCTITPAGRAWLAEKEKKHEQDK